MTDCSIVIPSGRPCENSPSTLRYGSALAACSGQSDGTDFPSGAKWVPRATP